jgi:hypothetical protein
MRSAPFVVHEGDSRGALAPDDRQFSLEVTVIADGDRDEEATWPIRC